jgi:Flp pilus assembly protein TadG
MMIAIMKKMKGQHGASAIEFAFLLPVMIIIICGIIDFGYVMYAKGVITNGSRVGARAGVVYSDPPVTNAEIVQVVSDYCSELIPSAALTTQVIRAGSNQGDPLTVRINYLHDLWFLPNWIGIGPIDLGAETVMLIE